jgi:hypothetical protein
MTLDNSTDPDSPHPWAALRGGRLRRRQPRLATPARRALVPRGPLPRWIVALGVFCAFLLLGWAGWLSCGFRGCPPVGTLTSYTPDGAPVLLDRDGEPFAELKPPATASSSWPPCPSTSAKPSSPSRTAASAATTGSTGRASPARCSPTSGRATSRRAPRRSPCSSPATSFPTASRRSARRWDRKLLEARVARKVENRFDKDQILELYLNYIYFGGGARGIDAASRLYFDKSPEDLTLADAALLAALPKAPTHYDPRRHPERARERRDLVLDLMVEQERIDPAERRGGQGGGPRHLQAVDAAEERDPLRPVLRRGGAQPARGALRRRHLHRAAADPHHPRPHRPAGSRGGARAPARAHRGWHLGPLHRHPLQRPPTRCRRRSPSTSREP